MATHIDIKPEMITWAIQRARLDDDALHSQIIQIAYQWIRGERRPTLTTLSDFARKVMVPFGYLFLDEPPDEPLPIADFRTFDDKDPPKPSPNLLDVIYEMQARQNWMRESALADDVESVEFVELLSGDEPIEEAARKIREHLQLKENWTTENKRQFQILRNAADKAGVLIFRNSRIGLGRRHLDPKEFRGFVLIDEYAPLVFVNSNDIATAQLFTLAHELVHLAMGQAGVFNLPNLHVGKEPAEKRCNAIAAELLVPKKIFLEQWKALPDEEPIYSLARHFGVSRTVIARRAWDLQLIQRKRFSTFYRRETDDREQQKAKRKEKKTTGGPTVYDILEQYLSPRFSRAVVEAARCGELLYHEAYELMGINGGTFREFARRIREGRNG
jgi:Zn-dependent peptidase ImmA (M78 family)